MGRLWSSFRFGSIGTKPLGHSIPPTQQSETTKIDAPEDLGGLFAPLRVTKCLSSESTNRTPEAIRGAVKL
jgi:hypothetical protein